jgi:hypothetical protein
VRKRDGQTEHTYSDELFEKICDRMGNGETLVQICRDEQVPD